MREIRKSGSEGGGTVRFLLPLSRGTSRIAENPILGVVSECSWMAGGPGGGSIH